MEEHVRSVERFHTALATQSSWLAAAEKSLRAFKVPSKLMDGIQAQICSLKVCIALSRVVHFYFFTCTFTSKNFSVPATTASITLITISWSWSTCTQHHINPGKLIYLLHWISKQFQLNLSWHCLPFSYRNMCIWCVSEHVGACCDMQVLRSDIDRHAMDMKNVDHTGTYLKYFGSKQDTVYVRNRLSSVRLRWKRLLRRVDETSRRLDRAFREAKRVNIYLMLRWMYMMLSLQCFDVVGSVTWRAYGLQESVLYDKDLVGSSFAWCQSNQHFIQIGMRLWHSTKQKGMFFYLAVTRFSKYVVEALNKEVIDVKFGRLDVLLCCL